jgi:hypothetical protein
LASTAAASKVRHLSPLAVRLRGEVQTVRAAC